MKDYGDFLTEALDMARIIRDHVSPEILRKHYPDTLKKINDVLRDGSEHQIDLDETGPCIPVAAVKEQICEETPAGYRFKNGILCPGCSTNNLYEHNFTDGNYEVLTEKDIPGEGCVCTGCGRNL